MLVCVCVCECACIMQVVCVYGQVEVLWEAIYNIIEKGNCTGPLSLVQSL